MSTIDWFKEEGRIEGRKEAEFETAKNMQKLGFSISQISSVLGLDEKSVLEILANLKK